MSIKTSITAISFPALLLSCGQEPGFVPVKLFARQFDAYVDVSSTLANTGMIWRKDIIEHMVQKGMNQAPGVLEAHAEGVIQGLDVRKPWGY